MSRRTGFAVRVLAVGLTVLLASAAVAMAASLAPKLESPNHRSVKAGRPMLHVKVPRRASAVFIAINPTKRRSHGRLVGTCSVSKGCDYLEATKHHGRVYYVKAAYGDFPGWWATTPGKYYWQAEYFTRNDRHHYYSKIGHFSIK